ncbi:MAG: hypothetical protein AAGA53_03695 [Pseudomonadota bacterium]
MNDSETCKFFDIETQRAMLALKIGIPGSGYDRYAAAMFLYACGELSHEMLEIYRRCCKFDFEDPHALARHEGLLVD